MNDELYNEIFNVASRKFQDYQSKPKGQMVSNKDNFDYWMVMVAYNMGCVQGYDDCIKERLDEEEEQ